MTPFDTVRITLVRAQDDEASFSPNYQHELKQFYHLVRADRTRMSAVAFTMADVTGDSGFTGEFVVPLNQEIGPVLDGPPLPGCKDVPGASCVSPWASSTLISVRSASLMHSSSKRVP
jgi:hypothetical protein